MINTYTFTSRTLKVENSFRKVLKLVVNLKQNKLFVNIPLYQKTAKIDTP